MSQSSMTTLLQFFTTPSVPQALLVIALVSIVGLFLGQIKFLSIQFGIFGVLVAGLLFSHFQITLSDPVSEILRDFGLVLFVYAVGLQVGPGFLSTLKKQGIILNSLAALIVVLGVGVVLLSHFVGGLPLLASCGIYSGAVTNTPSLATVQQVIKGFPTVTPEAALLPALGYAVSYPFGVFGVILAMLLIRRFFKVSIEAERHGFSSKRAHHSDAATVGSVSLPKILPLFIGIFLGVALGSIPVRIHGLPGAIRLGVAGGPLVVALILSHMRRVGPFHFRLPTPITTILREFGIILFLACVGLRSGGPFLKVLVHGDGLQWMMWGALVTFVPVFLVAVFTRLVYKMNFHTLVGLMAGSMTDPSA